MYLFWWSPFVRAFQGPPLPPITDTTASLGLSSGDFLFEKTKYPALIHIIEWDWSHHTTSWQILSIPPDTVNSLQIICSDLQDHQIFLWQITKSKANSSPLDLPARCLLKDLTQQEIHASHTNIMLRYACSVLQPNLYHQVRLMWSTLLYRYLLLHLHYSLQKINLFLLSSEIFPCARLLICELQSFPVQLLDIS